MNTAVGPVREQLGEYDCMGAMLSKPACSNETQ